MRSSPGARAFPYLMIAPTLLFLGLFVIYPLGQGLWMSLFSRGLIVSRTITSLRAVFVGLRNYARLLQDPSFLHVLLRTLVFAGIAVPLIISVSLMLAVFLRQRFTLAPLVRAIVYWPSMVSLIIVGIVWKWLLGFNSGMINYVAGLLGLAPVPWLLDGTLANLMVIMVWVWANAGFYMVIFIAGLDAIPAEYYEAAWVDGATRWDAFWRITVPMLRPTTLIVLVLASINAFKIFELVYSLTGGGPGDATVYLVQNIYDTAFTQPRGAGVAAAQSGVLFVILMILTVVQLRYRGEPT